MKLHHFVWYPIEGKGYVDRPIAYSEGFNPSIYASMFKNEFIPITVSYSKENFRAYMLFNNKSKAHVLFSSIFTRKAVDEYGRTGVYHHSAIIERSALAKGKVSIFAIEKAIREYDKANEKPKGTIEPLDVEENETPSLSYKAGLKNYLSRAVVETLATRTMASRYNHTILRCLGASKMDRFRIGVYLVELLNFVCGVRPISFTTEPPLSADYYPLFDLLILERAYPPERDADKWAVLKWDIDKPQLKRLKGKEAVYKRIYEAFR